MFYQFCGSLVPTELNALKPGLLTVGYIEKDEAQAVCSKFGFHPEALQSSGSRFRSGVELYEDYTFTELRAINVRAPGEDDDCVALFLNASLFLVIDLEDHDGSIKKRFEAVAAKYAAKNVGVEKLVYAFLDGLILGDETYIEDLGMTLAALEEDVFHGRTRSDFNTELLKQKTQLLRMRNYYEQLLDITEALEENENELLDEDRLMCVANLSKKVVRLREDVDSLGSLLSHLQDAYSAYLDLQLNRSMKVFTVLTSIFFPMTIIAGWYGMNFTHMPELHWRYGYIYVILLSAAISGALVLIGKKRKWF